jgi:putative DNA methylase
MINSTQARATTQNDGTTTRFNAAFARNDLPMNWDFAEVNPMGETGTWLGSLSTILHALDFAVHGEGVAVRADARTAIAPSPCLVAADPPYFDAIGYADLSDYFYVWHRRALQKVHPDLYRTIAAPKVGELTAIPSHHGNDKWAAREYFINGFTETFRNLQKSMGTGLPLLVVYASKEQKGGREEETRWSSILTAMVDADLEITGTWPIHGTSVARLIGQGTNAVAS